jgi:hypothetical protein
MSWRGRSARLVGALAGALACSPGGGVRFDAPEGELSGFAGSEGSESSGGSGAPPATSSPPATGEPTGGEDTGEAPTTGTLVPARARWRYLASATPPPADWAAPGFDDAAWLAGEAPLGDAGEVATAVDPASAPVGVYLRRRFTAAPGAGRLLLYLRRGDGAAVYLNGEEVARSNLPAGALGPDALAVDDLAGDEVLRYLRFAAPAAGLVAGENTVAVALRRAAAGAPGLTFDLQVDAVAALPDDELRVQWRTRSYGGEYAPDNVGAAWVEREGGAFVRTLTVWAEVRREHLVRWQAGAGGDVTDATTSATRGSHRTSDVGWDLRDAQGQPAGPGDYRLLLEFTEADSNKGDPAGPRLEIPFTLGDGPGVPSPPSHPQFADVLVLAP